MLPVPGAADSTGMQKHVTRIRIEAGENLGSDGPPKSPAASLTPRAMRELCDETSSDDEDGDDVARSRSREAPATSDLKLNPASASTSRASSANADLSAGERSARRVADLRTLSLSERQRRKDANEQVARSFSQSAELDKELSSVRKQISLLVEVDGLPITEHPLPDGSPSAPRKCLQTQPSRCHRTVFLLVQLFFFPCVLPLRTQAEFRLQSRRQTHRA